MIYEQLNCCRGKRYKWTKNSLMTHQYCDSRIRGCLSEKNLGIGKMKSQLVALFIFAFLLMSMVKETDCFRTDRNGKRYEDRDEGKRGKKLQLTARRSVCEAARHLECDRELEDEPKD